MHRWLGNLSLGPRVIAAVSVPVVGLIGLAAVEITVARDTAVRADHVAELADLAPQVSGALHELQKERGAAVGFVQSSGKSFADILPDQRRVADAETSKLATALQNFHYVGDEAELRRTIESALSGIAALPALRREVDGLAIDAPAALERYNDLIGELLGVISGLAYANEDAEVAKEIGAYFSMQKMKDAAGLERATGAAGFLENSFAFPAALIPRMSALIASQEIHLASFKASASEADIAAYTQSVQGPVLQKIEDLRAFALSGGGDGGGVSGAEWFALASERIDMMKQAEGTLAANLRRLAADKAESAWSAFSRLSGGVLAVLAVALLAAVLVVRSIAKPLGRLIGATEEVAKGAEGVDIPGVERKDEIGILARSLDTAQTNAAEMKRMRQEQEAKDMETAARHRQEILQMADSFEQSVIGVVEALARSADEMQTAAASMRDSASDTSRQTQLVAETSRQAASNVQAVASATEELDASVREISRQSADTSSMSKEAVVEAEGAQESCQRLNEASQRIGDVIGLINDIAEQTNLLALNATIEAARAGEAGKGFAVVAAEVKSLANQTANATGEIGDQVKRMQEETASAVQVIDAISGAISGIHDIAQAVSTAADEQSAATAEISANVQEAATGAQHVDETMDSVREGADATGANASQVLSAAQELNEQSANLRSELAAFLDKVRAA